MSARLSGGQNIERVLASIGKRLAGGDEVKVGYLSTATYPDGTPVAQVAFWQEFGTPGARFPIPPRPTFRMMIAAHSKEWGGELAKLLKAQGYNAHAALTAMGQRIKEQLQDSVLNAAVLSLSPVTLMLRKMRSQTPGLRVTLRTVFEAIGRVRAGETGATGTQAKRLVDTGVMVRSVDYVVSP